MKTITPITSGTYGYGTDPYWPADYAEAGYVVTLDVIRFRFRYQNDLVEFVRGPQFPGFSYDFIQPEEKSTVDWPIVGAPVVIQAPFEFTFPCMTDTELSNLRTFMLSVVPVGASFSFEDVGNGKSMAVRFASLRMRVKHIRPGYSEVKIAMVRA